CRRRAFPPSSPAPTRRRRAGGRARRPRRPSVRRHSGPPTPCPTDRALLRRLRRRTGLDPPSALQAPACTPRQAPQPAQSRRATARRATSVEHVDAGDRNDKASAPLANVGELLRDLFLKIP